MNIAGSPLKCSENDRIHEADDRARFALGDLLDRDRLFTGFVLADQIQLEPFGRLFEHALRRFRFLQQILNFRKRGDVDDQRAAEQGRDFVNDDKITRIRHGHDKRISLHPQGYKVVPEHQVDLGRMEQLQV